MRVLIVEDNDQYRKLLDDGFSGMHHTVFLAQDGKQALQILDQILVDVVICDIEMPEMRGTELHDVLRKDSRYQRLPFIYLTGYSDLRLLAEELKDDFVKVVNKVTPFREILHTVSEMASQCSSYAA